MSEKGLLASVCSFFSGLFASDDQNKPVSTSIKSSDGLTGVERYIRNQSQNGGQMTGVERYVRNQLSNSNPLTGVEKYLRNQANAKPLTGVERFIRSQ